MGLKVGDTIIGREEWPGGWEEAKLTLCFLGKQEAVFEEKDRNFMSPRWTSKGESANWTLSCRVWYLVANKEKTPE